MGQSSIDLPDPMQVEGVQAVQNADDLLSQLAGNEIDGCWRKTTMEQPRGKQNHQSIIRGTIIRLRYPPTSRHPRVMSRR